MVPGKDFSDSVKTNSALVRKRLRDTRMKVEEYQRGAFQYNDADTVYRRSGT